MYIIFQTYITWPNSEIIVWNIKGLRNRILKIKKLENQSLWQKLNSFNVLNFQSEKLLNNIFFKSKPRMVD